MTFFSVLISFAGNDVNTTETILSFPILVVNL